MRATFTITYNPLDIGDKEYINTIEQAQNYRDILCSLKEHLRANIKYGGKKDAIDRYIRNTFCDENITNINIEEQIKNVFDKLTENDKDKIYEGYVLALEDIHSLLWDLINEYNIQLD